MATNYTLEELADLETAFAAGVLRVSHGGTTTEFTSTDDMLRRIRVIRIALGLPINDRPSTKPAIRRLRFLMTKGL